MECGDAIAALYSARSAGVGDKARDKEIGARTNG
jgi:hypothetical protein